MIALLLASITMLAMVRHYLNSKEHYHHMQIKLDQSIELQLVSDLIRDSSRRAGFTPCLGIEHLTTEDQRNNHKRLFATEIDQAGGASVKMNRMSEYFDTVLQVIGQNELLTTKNQVVHRDQSILIADCYHAEVQKIGRIKHSADDQMITLTQPLAFSYYPPIYMGAWLEETYSIRKQGTLFYHFQHAEELTTAVHNLSAYAEQHQGGTLLRVILGLAKGHQLELSTMVRIP